jgi:hypothetical protein
LQGAIAQGDEGETEDLYEKASDDEGQALSEACEEEEGCESEQPAGDH